jgi:iron(II)-dependent oxidoreductase
MTQLTRERLVAEIAQARQHTDQLFEAIVPTALFERPIRERHRLIFYLGHLEAFDWNQVCRAGLDVPSFHPEFDRLFEFGIDPAVGSEPSDQPADWPSCQQVRAYNHRVRDAFDEHAAEASPDLLAVALEHRLMHAETLAYLLHRLPFHLKRGPDPSPKSGPAPENPLLDIPAGPATLGMLEGEGFFGWDNEFAAHTVQVSEFRLSRYKVTNGEYLEFVQQGGPVPPFWIRRDAQWFLFCMFGETPLLLDRPVYATHEQACAYAAFRGLALPTEAQFHRAAFGTTGGDERAFPWGYAKPETREGNFGFRAWDTVPVASTPGGDSAFGLAQMVGNGWEWTSTVFAPFEGFRTLPTYPGYSTNFFDGRHYVLKGGSPRTAFRLLRRSFRNWFRPDYPHVYASFRLAENF